MYRKMKLFMASWIASRIEINTAGFGVLCATISVPSGPASEPTIAEPLGCGSTSLGLAKRRKR
jgi:hypothetical protein